MKLCLPYKRHTSVPRNIRVCTVVVDHLNKRLPSECCAAEYHIVKRMRREIRGANVLILLAGEPVVESFELCLHEFVARFTLGDLQP